MMLCSGIASRLSLASLLIGLFMAPAAADPSAWKAEGWKTDFTRTSIKWEEILSGGPPKDGIPAIDAPSFRPIAEAKDLAPNEPVIGLEIAGDARAYPLRILIWHEIANDIVGGTPVAVTYCPLCNSAVVFERTVSGRVLDFGTSGKLRNSDLVMYDRQTESWWQQFVGEAIVGAMQGAELKRVPSWLTSFAEFKAHHPNARVLVPNNPAARPYGRNPYFGYDTSARPFLFKGEMPKDIEPMARVVVVRPASGRIVIVALDHIRLRGPISINGVELQWQSGQSSALDSDQIAKGRDVGTVSAFEKLANGERKAIPYDVTFAFVAHAFQPAVPILQK
ncbi:MAG: DUF3179 domain-containing protein [Hyphomicrobiaceae bacterium]|nr:MAG: DUF3179 domain-containing protein [Hyphomicrobiaceae bacterium]